MAGIRSRNRFVHALLCLAATLALLSAAFAHASASATIADRVDMSAFAFPDGSLPVLCTPSQSDDGGSQPRAGTCDYCRLSGAVILPAPKCGADPLFRLVQPACYVTPPHRKFAAPVFSASKPLRGPPAI